jgi:TRAP-type C4-dicarboxylate transport system substrate-binding protein
MLRNRVVPEVSQRQSLRRLLIIGVSAIGLAIGLTELTLAQDVTRLRLSHWAPAGHAMATYLEDWANELEAASNGRLRIDVFPGGQLGDVTDHYDMVRRGVVDIGWILHGATSDRFPLTGLIDIPFIVDSAVHGTRILNDPELRERYLDAEHRGLKVLYLFTHQPAQIHTADKTIMTPADVAGLRIRFPSATAKVFLDQLGADSVGLPPSEIAEAMQRRVVDGVLIDYGGAGIAFQLGGLVGDVAEVNAYVTSFGMVMNPRSWDRLPGDLKSLITDSLAGIEARVGAIWDGLNGPGKQALIEGGAEIHVPDDAAMEQFRRIAASVAETVVSERESAGADARAAYELMLELAARYRE